MAQSCPLQEQTKNDFMKKLILLAGLVIVGATVQAQNKTSYISLGPVGGVGHTWITNVQGNTDFKISPALGIGMVYSKHEHIGWGADLLVSHEGYTSETMLEGNKYDVIVNPVFLRLNPKFLYFFGRYGDGIRPKLYVGPSLGVKIDEVRDFSINNEGNGDADLNTDSDMFNTVDFGLQAGAGVNIRLKSNMWLGLDAGYYHGLLDMLDNQFGDANNMSRNVRLNVGVMWGL